MLRQPRRSLDKIGGAGMRCIHSEGTSEFGAATCAVCIFSSKPRWGANCSCARGVVAASNILAHKGHIKNRWEGATLRRASQRDAYPPRPAGTTNSRVSTTYKNPDTNAAGNDAVRNR